MPLHGEPVQYDRALDRSTHASQHAASGVLGCSLSIKASSPYFATYKIPNEGDQPLASTYAMVCSKFMANLIHDSVIIGFPLCLLNWVALLRRTAGPGLASQLIWSSSST